LCYNKSLILALRVWEIRGKYAPSPFRPAPEMCYNQRQTP